MYYRIVNVYLRSFGVIYIYISFAICNTKHRCILCNCYWSNCHLTLYTNVNYIHVYTYRVNHIYIYDEYMYLKNVCENNHSSYIYIYIYNTSGTISFLHLFAVKSHTLKVPSWSPDISSAWLGWRITLVTAPLPS
jgi:hypothetical protein